MANLKLSQEELDQYMKEFKAPMPEQKQKKQEEAVQKAQVIIENKESIKEAVKANPVINKQQEKEIKKHLDNPREVLKSAEKATGAEEQSPEDASLSNQFKQALTFFAPQLIAGAIGGMAEGDEGLVAGFNAGGQLRDSYINYQRKNAEAQYKAQQELKKQQTPNKVDITPDFQIKGTQEPVFSRTNKKTGIPEFINTKGEVVNPGDLERISTAEMRLREAGISERHGANIGQREIDRIDKGIKSFTSKADIKKAIDSETTIDPVVNLLESNMPITGDFLAPFIARGVQKEVGNLSETDLAKARVPLDIVNKVKSNIRGFLQGEMSPKERKDTIRLLKFMQEKNREQLSAKVEGYVTPERAKRLGVSVEDLKKQIQSEVGIKAPKPGQKQITEQDIDNMSLEELKAAGLI